MTRKEKNKANVEIMSKISSCPPKEQAEIKEFIDKHGPELDWIDARRRTMLHYASECADSTIAIFKFLISEGLDVNVADRSGYTPLHNAARNNNDVEVIKLLVDAGADVMAEVYHIYLWTPLHSAICNKNVEIAKYLVSVGADVNAGLLECMPLYQSICHYNLEAALFLIAAGADANAPAEYGSPLHAAVCVNKPGYLDLAKLLVSKGAEVNRQDKDGYTPLHTASRHNGDVEFTKFLVSQVADVNVKTKSGKLPIDLAKESGHTAVVKYLESV